MARRSPPRKVTYFESVPPRLARNTIIESTGLTIAGARSQPVRNRDVKAYGCRI